MLDVISFQYSSELDLQYKADGHRHIRVPMFFNKVSFINHAVYFIFDTGAYLTVLSRKTARKLGYDKIKPIQSRIKLTGFADSQCEGDLVEIPAMMIGGRMIEDVRVAIPYVVTEDDILGLNVLEYFNYLIDSANDKIYFSDNPVYKAPKELGCGKITPVSKN